MKIGEARKTYSAPLREFWEEKKSLAKQKKAYHKKYYKEHDSLKTQTRM